MSVFSGFDFIAITIVSLVIGILGLVVYLNDRRNITNKTFFAFTFLTIIYATINYLSSRGGSPNQVLWILRFTIFSAVWHAFCIFQLFFVLPKAEMRFPRYYKFIILLAALVSIITLTPLVFSKVTEVAPVGYVTNPERGPAIALFGMVSFGLIGAGIALMIRKTLRAMGLERKQLSYVLAGIAITVLLIFVFNFVLPVVFNNLGFISLVPIYFFPFIILTAYAIIRYRLLDIKVIATELLTFALWVLLLIRLLAARDTYDVVIGSILFIGSLALGILLIRSVLQEVKLRERMEKLAVDLEVANADLKRLDEAKSDFISIASHQLRTPLSIIKGYISMMREGTFGKLDAKITDPLEKVYVSNERLITLVNDLLDLSRMERGRMQFDMRPMHFNEIVEPMVNDFQIVARNKKMQLVWEKDFQSDLINGDANKLRQIILNLIDNAFKYTPSGTVKVRLAQEGDAIRFCVHDTGPGLTEEESRKLFQKFVRGKEQRAAHTEGLGLGLYVAKLIAEAHGGSIGATSPGKGKGSTFYLVLPLELKASSIKTQ